MYSNHMNLLKRMFCGNLTVPFSIFSFSSIHFFPYPGNGYIPTSSLREILAALDDQLTSDQLNEMIAEIDTDSSGTVDFDGELCVGNF